ETLVPVQDIEAEKTENTSHNSNQEPTVQETEVVEQDIQMDDVANLPETEGAQSSLFTERVEMSVNVEPSITGNIAPINLIANNRESAWKVNNTSHDQPNPINSRNEDITQPKEGDEFTEVTYSKKKEKSNNIKKDKREYSGPYKKSKTLQ
ncbi:8092_t:CDS:1, partial [Gigaspora rosea]